jgi:hypothetical protein
MRRFLAGAAFIIAIVAVTWFVVAVLVNQTTN